MYQVIIARALPDDTKVVDEREVCLTILESRLKAFLRNASGVICLIGRLADTQNTLRLKMKISADILAVDREGN
jgi:hypothetical protein